LFDGVFYIRDTVNLGISQRSSFDRTSGVLKSKGFYKDFIEASSANVDTVDEVNSISKLTVLQAMRDGDFSPENLENVFNTMLGDAQVRVHVSRRCFDEIFVKTFTLKHA
jgi:hypothetical protein